LEDIFIRFGATHERDGRTDGRTDRQTDRHRVTEIAALCIASHGKSYDDMLSHFRLVPERNGQTDGRTDRHTDRQICYINIARQYADAR